ncbi:ATP-binding protein [Saccharomonospora sp. NPDC046836]|uniref:sensor histidine kinase n=1 Tax=Saccharomonospora sp. NPDC046836 TaxID=3156921 RepID=UPI00340BAE34
MAAEAGPTESHLNRAIQRYAVSVRVLVIMSCAGLGLLAVPARYLPVALLAGAVALAWCGLSLYWLRSAPPLARIVAAALVSVLLIQLTQAWTGPAEFNSWVFAVASITAISAQFELARHRGAALLVSLVTVLAYVAGSAVIRPPGEAVVSGVRLLVETALSWVAYLLVRRQARAADRRNAWAAEQRRAAGVAAARRAAEREYLATLHDTASATLLMVSLGAGDRSWVADRARRDIETLTAPLTGAARQVDLVPLLRQAADDPAVAVDVELPGTLSLPAAPALAVAHGVREAVLNVVRHAGVSAATLRASCDEDGRLVVELSDQGAGFDTDLVAEHRRGLTGSIIGRMTAVGGATEIDSAPGRGTTVRWTWHA